MTEVTLEILDPRDLNSPSAVRVRADVIPYPGKPEFVLVVVYDLYTARVHRSTVENHVFTVSCLGDIKYVKLAEPEPLTWDGWPVIEACWKFLAMDKNKHWYFYTHKPERKGQEWCPYGHDRRNWRAKAWHLDSPLNPPNAEGLDWTETLIERT